MRAAGLERELGLLSFVLLSPRMIAILSRAQFAGSRRSRRAAPRGTHWRASRQLRARGLLRLGASRTRRRQNGAAVQPSEVVSISILAALVQALALEPADRGRQVGRRERRPESVRSPERRDLVRDLGRGSCRCAPGVDAADLDRLPTSKPSSSEAGQVEPLARVSVRWPSESMPKVRLPRKRRDGT